MKTFIKKIIVISFILFFSFNAFSKEVHLILLYTNDTHGHLFPFDHKQGKNIGGISRRANLIKQARQEPNCSVIVLDAGDVFQGTPMSSMFKGKVDFEIMSIIGYDAMTLGDHEFDFGQKILLQRIKEREFPVVCANVVREQDNKLFLEPMVIKNIQDLKIGIIGVTAEEVPVTTSPANVKGLRFLNPKETIKKLLKESKEKPDIIILLSHCGYDYDRQIAKSIPEINIIIGGHTHTKIEKPSIINKTIVVQAYQWGIYLGRLDLIVSDAEKNKYAMKDFRGELILVSDTVPSIPEIDSILNQYNSKLTKQMEKVIGSAEIYFDNSRCRNTETEIGNFIADAIRHIAKVDISFQNGGGIRFFLDKGPVTVEEIYNVIPFESFIITLELNGEQIEKILQRSLTTRDKFLQVSGLKARMKNNKIVDIKTGESKIIGDKNYRIAVNDFLAAGGDGYDVFKQGRNIKNTGINLRDALIEYIETKKIITGRIEGRCKVEK